MWKLVPFEEKGVKMIHHRLPAWLSALPITSAFYAGAYTLAHARFSANWGRGGYACPLRPSASREKFCCSSTANFLSATKRKITIFPSPLFNFHRKQVISISFCGISKAVKIPCACPFPKEDASRNRIIFFTLFNVL